MEWTAICSPASPDQELFSWVFSTSQINEDPATDPQPQVFYLTTLFTFASFIPFNMYLILTILLLPTIYSQLTLETDPIHTPACILSGKVGSDKMIPASSCKLAVNACNVYNISEPLLFKLDGGQNLNSVTPFPKLGRNPIYFPYNKYQSILHSSALFVINNKLRSCPRNLARVAVNHLSSLCTQEERQLLPSQNAFRTRVLDYIRTKLGNPIRGPKQRGRQEFGCQFPICQTTALK